jgi:Cas7 group CRISPR-associated protein Csh2
VFADLQSQFGFDPERFFVFESEKKGYDDLEPLAAMKKSMQLAVESPEAFCSRYMDVRDWGTVALEQKMKGADGKKLDAPRFKRTGPMTLTRAVSVAPIEIVTAAGTKKYTLQAKNIEDGNGTFASESFVRHGLYVALLSVNPAVARATWTTEEDVEFLKGSMKYIFSNSMACGRPASSLELVRFWWADHTNALGSFNENEFLRSVTPIKKQNPDEPSTCLDDYILPEPPESFGAVNWA